MSNRIFVDTNIFVYAYTNNSVEKHEAAKRILQTSDDHYIISTQVLNEFYVTLSKYKVEHDKITTTVSEIIKSCEVQPVKLETVNIALAVKKRYDFSYWDSLILAAALENSCSSVYSEDMSDGQFIYGNAFESLNIANNVLIQNPFTFK